METSGKLVVQDWKGGTDAAERLQQVRLATAYIAHDLRDLINVVQGVADLAAQGIFTPGMGPMLRRSTRQMSGMTQELLDYVDGAGALELRRVSAEQLVAELDAGALSLLPGRGIQVERQVLPGLWLEVDPAKLVRALSNLINNARDAMPHGGTLTLEVFRTAAGVAFRISDTGKGIPEEILPRVFEPHVTHGKVGGTGLGTASAKDVVEAHGGSISVCSTPGVGTVFEVVVPA